MKPVVWLSLLLCVFLSIAVESGAQTLVGALAVDERRGERWGWAVDYETEAAAREAALRECGAACSVVLTFDRCGAYATDQNADSTTVGWAEAYASADAARQAALAECRSRGGGSGCTVRAWSCNGPVVEAGLNLDRATRRRIQQGLAAGSFDPGAADGLFGPRTRAAIRRWQSSRGARPTGYLDSASAEALQTTDRSGPAASAEAMQAPPPPASAELEGLFWQSIMNSTNPAEFEAYLRRFPNGVFSELAQARRAALQSAPASPPAAAGTPIARAGAPASGARAAGGRASGAAAPGFGATAGGAVRRRPGEVFRDCAECPELVMLSASGLAMGRYEVTVGEYRAFALATGGGAGDGCFLPFSGGNSWRNPGFPQTDRHPVACVSWDDAQAYVSWLSRTTGARYRLPTETEWEQAAAGSEPGCHKDRTGNFGTCPVGSYGSNAAGLSDMVGNVREWTQDCWEDDCGERVHRGGSWLNDAESWGLSWGLSVSDRGSSRAEDTRSGRLGFRVARTIGAP